MSNYTSVFLTNLSIHPSWDDFFADPKVQAELKNIETALQSVNYTPHATVALRFATVDLKMVKVSIFGKDPYPQAGVATGRSFEVNGVTSWCDTAVNSSLKNIIKLIHKGHTGSKKGASINKVREDSKSDAFPILPPHKAFSHWESKGVLFLNTAFTCEVGMIDQAGSHLFLWKRFFALLMDYMVNENKDIKYFLWGSAKDYAAKLINLGVNHKKLYLSNHPCTNGDNGGYENGTKFLNNPCFRDTFKSIEWV